MLHFMIVVNDNGELKSVSAEEFNAAIEEAMRVFGFNEGAGTRMVEQELSHILDQQAIEPVHTDDEGVPY